MAKTTINLYYNNGGPESIVDINLGESEESLKGTVKLTQFVNLTSFEGGSNNIENVIGLKNLNSLQKFSIIGANTLGINISSLPTGLDIFDVRGENLTNGDINTLPDFLSTFNNLGENETTGNIASLSSKNIVSYRNLGSNTTFGDIGRLPTSLLFYHNEGNNTTFGNLSTLPQNIVYFRNLGLNTVNSYYDGTGGGGYEKRVWANGMRYIEIVPTLNLGQPRIPVSHLVTLLVDLTSTTWSGEKTIKIDGPNNPIINLTTYPQARTAITTLTSAPNNVNVFLNLSA